MRIAMSEVGMTTQTKSARSNAVNVGKHRFITPRGKAYPEGMCTKSGTPELTPHHGSLSKSR